MNICKKVREYIEQTGSTYYSPTNDQEFNALEEMVSKGFLVKNNEMYTLPSIAIWEKNIGLYAVSRYYYGNEKRKKYNDKELDFFISLYEFRENINLDEWQKAAVYNAMNENIFILTGGPGTGKTCILKCIYFCLQNVAHMKNIKFCAPTGKAARRITESIGVSASTVQKMLGLKDDKAKPISFSADAVIVDEISMLDTMTAMKLFMGVTLDTKLILVGDVEQLPSVGAGSVLRDLIDSGLPSLKLEKTFRQASESGLFANIEQIKKGLYVGFVEREDFVVHQMSNPKEAKQKMIQEYLSAAKEYGIDNVVCLTPFRRKGEACAIKINEALQTLVNPLNNNKGFVTFTSTEEDGFSYNLRLQVDDPVMQLINAEKVANGDVGKIIFAKDGVVKVQFSDCIVEYTEENFNELCLAYAMSVHKSQGSEYKCVITSAISSDEAMLNRNTIYTAVTRAKQKCIVISDGITAKKACTIEAGYERVTNLCKEIKSQMWRYKFLTKVLTN